MSKVCLLLRKEMVEAKPIKLKRKSRKTKNKAKFQIKGFIVRALVDSP